MNRFAILANIGPADVLDILFITMVAYHLYMWFWGTKAFKALAGIVLLSGIYILAESWGLFLTTWVFQILWQVFVILLIILFQKEIRQMLERFNPMKKLGYKRGETGFDWVDGVSRWAFDAAGKRLGVLIVFERSDLVFDLVTKGVALESDPSAEILQSIFIKDSPLHDGAALISGGRLLKASCFLPLTVQEELPREWGTRHRAAFGLTEQADACVLIVSEERGEVSLAVEKKITTVHSPAELSQALTALLMAGKKREKPSLGETLKSWATRRFKLKLSAFAAVFVLWLLFAGQQDVEKRIHLPLEFENLSPSLVLAGADRPGVRIICRGLRKDVSLLNRSNVRAVVDLASAGQGDRVFPLGQQNMVLPNDRVHVVRVSPSRIELSFETAQ